MFPFALKTCFCPNLSQRVQPTLAHLNQFRISNLSLSVMLDRHQRPARQVLDSDLIKSSTGATEGVLTGLRLNPVAWHPVVCSTLGLLMSVFVLLEYAEQTDLQGVGAATWTRCGGGVGKRKRRSRSPRRAPASVLGMPLRPAASNVPLAHMRRSIPVGTERTPKPCR